MERPADTVASQCDARQGPTINSFSPSPSNPTHQKPRRGFCFLLLAVRTNERQKRHFSSRHEREGSAVCDPAHVLPPSHVEEPVQTPPVRGRNKGNTRKGVERGGVRGGWGDQGDASKATPESQMKTIISHHKLTNGDILSQRFFGSTVLLVLAQYPLCPLHD